jgi:hypothetical protein
MAFTIAIAWYAIGVAGFIYWWTSEHDLDGTMAAFSLFVGLMGPCAWGLGFLIHSPRARVIIRKRRPQP